MEALAVIDISVRFGGVAALTDASFAVAAGEVCGLIGPNGAGKTTLFDVVSGVRRPGSGRVVLGGTDVTGWPAHRRARAGLRRTFQRVQPFGWLSVADNALAAVEWRGGGGGLPADLVGLPRRRRLAGERRHAVTAVLERTGAAGLAGRTTGGLPIGAARRVELARALADDPVVVLLDEPTSGLDDTEIARLGHEIDALAAGGVAVVLVEHNVPFVMAHSARVVVLDQGRVLATGTPDAIRADAAVRAAYLGDAPSKENH